MFRKRKDELVNKDELMNLTKIAKSWDFTCSFCFKRFDSAQSMGGHQNAHRKERSEEWRLRVKGHISRRMRVFLQTKKSKEAGSTSSHSHTSNSSVVRGRPSKARVLLTWSSKDSSVANINGENLKIEAGFAAKNRLELNLGVGAEEERDDKENACVHDFNIDGYGITNPQDHNLDLTLKL